MGRRVDRLQGAVPFLDWCAERGIARPAARGGSKRLREQALVALLESLVERSQMNRLLLR